MTNEMHRHSPSRSLFLWLGIILATTITVAFATYLMFPMESYFPLYPGIGTTFAPDYSEEGFNQIRVGMNRDEVLAFIGEPLKTAPGVNSEHWYYSEDGGAFGDFAWLYRSVAIHDDGTVVEVGRAIHYD